MTRNRRYFASYQFNDRNGSGFGRAVVDIPEGDCRYGMQNADAVNAMERGLAADINASGIVLLGWQPMAEFDDGKGDEYGDEH
ncbi:hypothetical protein [Frankia sp. Cj3]|uniref:hypothetical protein n=1 Tax=Frankia sp. Cj3 TaxID=2880976 RepID=UPI001EF722DE|nr:hypothetical protein [Frankia sp. Cj3]